MMVDHDNVEPRIRCIRQGREGGGAAIDRDDQRDALFLQFQQGRRIWAVSLGDPVRHVDMQVTP